MDQVEHASWATKWANFVSQFDGHAEKLQEYVDQGEAGDKVKCKEVLDGATTMSSEYKRVKGLYDYCIRSNNKKKEALTKAADQAKADEL